MKKATIYHNPRCSKSRQALQLLEDNNASVEIILYLKTPPTMDELRVLLKKLKCDAKDLVRKKDAAFKALNFDSQAASDADWLTLLHQQPALLERPIVTVANKAVIGRPPENILEII